MLSINKETDEGDMCVHMKNRYIYLAVCCCMLFFGCAQDERDFPYIKTIGNEVKLQTDVSRLFAEKAIKKFAGVYTAYGTLIPFPSKRNRPFGISNIKNKKEFLRYQARIGPTESGVGFYIPDRGELVLLYQGRAVTLKTLYHEAFHAYFEDRIIHPPAWLNEGLAQYAETLQFGFFDKVTFGKTNHKWDKTLARMSQRNTIPHIRDIIKHDWPDRHSLTDEQYAASLSLISFLKSGKREEAFNRYLQLLYNKDDPQQAFQRVWPDLDAFNKAWKTYIKKDVRKRNLLRLLPGI